MGIRLRIKKKVLFFSILALMLVLMNAWLDRELNPHYPLKYSEVFHPRVNADVVILGACEVAQGINPKYLEGNHSKVFNFALNGAGPSFHLKWYKNIFQPHYPRPLYVIYGVHWAMFDETLYQRKLEHDSKYFPRQFLYDGLRDLDALTTLILNRFAFIRERKQLTHRLFGRGEGHLVFSRYYQGFIPYERRGRVDRKTDVKLQNSKAQIHAFEELLDEFEKSKIQVILVQVPGYLPAQNFSNIEESMRLINRIAEERKIPFLDYNTKRIPNINTDPSMFADWLHLNERGSDAFSRLLKGDIESFLKQKAASGRDPQPEVKS
jgi:hypothetical protein